jgi:hypothetical protein
MTLIATKFGGSADRVSPAATGEPDNANAVEKAKKMLICQSLTEAASQWAPVEAPNNLPVLLTRPINSAMILKRLS